MCAFEYFLEIGKSIIRDSTDKQEMSRGGSWTSGAKFSCRLFVWIMQPDIKVLKYGSNMQIRCTSNGLISTLMPDDAFRISKTSHVGGKEGGRRCVYILQHGINKQWDSSIIMISAVFGSHMCFGGMICIFLLTRYLLFVSISVGLWPYPLPLLAFRALMVYMGIHQLLPAYLRDWTLPKNIPLLLKQTYGPP